MRRWTVVTAVLVLVAAGGAWAARVGFRDGPLPPPDGPWPMTAKVQISMCTEDAALPECEGRPLATTKQGQAVLDKLQAMHGISEARITRGLDGDVAYVNAALAGRDDFPAIKAAVEQLPGVGKATGWPTGFWADKSDVEISLCPRKEPGDSGLCAGRGAATENEKETIYQRLRELPEVGEIYFADSAFVLREARHNARGGMSGGWNLMESDPFEQFQVRLAASGSQGRQLRAEDAAEKIRKLAEGLPGVWMAR